MALEDIKTVGVVGAGTMGFGLSINFALWGYPTYVHDLTQVALDRAKGNIEAALTLMVDEGLIIEPQANETLSRLRMTTNLTDLAQNSDFITEAIVDRSEDKRQLFNFLDEHSPAHTIFASNTSYLVLSDFGSDVKRQDKLVLTHYFAPPHLVPGVEVAKGPKTSDETIETTCALLKQVKKIPTRLQKELPGYLINRIQLAMNKEAMNLWAEGMASAEEIEQAIITTFGFRMPHEGPFLHYDLAGLWRWPEDVRNPGAIEDEKIRERMSEGKPWFIKTDPTAFDEALEKRDREFARRLKALYWDSLTD